MIIRTLKIVFIIIKLYIYIYIYINDLYYNYNKYSQFTNYNFIENNYKMYQLFVNIYIYICY